MLLTLKHLLKLFSKILYLKNNSLNASDFEAFTETIWQGYLH